jgi:hypothetical protein
MKTLTLLLCAWVLWTEDVVMTGTVKSAPEWVTVGAVASMEECHDRLAKKRDDIAAVRAGNTADFTGAAVEDNHVIAAYRARVPAVRFTRLLCLPDTVDPRGPK